jgi:pyruvate ferredoxin oxidoreductase gamma subunit
MIRIRFHGRGGHGVKTASRIAGTAAFLSGWQVQDSPVYGAERRGASVTAFTRIDNVPILERGVIDQPDLIIVGDETLLADPTAGVLAGQETASAVFVNAQADGRLPEKYGISSPLVTLDVTGRTLDALGKASALSAGLGAVAARLAACATIERLREAVREELGEVGLADDVIAHNVVLAEAIFNALPAIKLHVSPSPAAAEVCRLPFEPPFRAAPSIVMAGNAQQLHTGSWRVERPVVDFDRCTRCGLCFVACPDGSIALDHEGYPLIDYDHCKGCMICREVCPLEAIGAKQEVRSW